MSAEAPLAGKVAIIAGAGEGVGRSCALLLARDGADIAVAARRAEPLATLAREVEEASGRRVIAVPTDMSDVDQCRALVDSVAAQLGGVDVVVNVATTNGANAPVGDVDWDAYRRAFELNVIGTMEISRAAAAVMATRGGGSIIQISTLGVHTMLPRQSAYSSTKSAMTVASFTMAKEVGRHGVRVNIVSPGYINGPPLESMFAGIGERAGMTTEAASQRAADAAALRRHVDPDDIAEAVAFLASPRARNITGVELRVDAGQLVG
jgi:NAD(P)-dependent dehydrogenase (short-subunit alcohol dehydrogenase family)